MPDQSNTTEPSATPDSTVTENARANEPQTVPVASLQQPVETDSVTTEQQTKVAEAPRERLLFTPPIDIYESDDGLVLEADLPGVSIESLELEVQDNKLTLFGRVALSVPPDAVAIHQEYREGDFVRSFILSDEVDYGRITANMSNGVLKVTLPKAPQAEPRRIKVNSE